MISKKGMALSQVMILLIGFIAVVHMLGGVEGSGEESAAESGGATPPGESDAPASQEPRRGVELSTGTLDVVTTTDTRATLTVTQDISGVTFTDSNNKVTSKGIPEGTRIQIDGDSITIENRGTMTQEEFNNLLSQNPNSVKMTSEDTRYFSLKDSSGKTIYYKIDDSGNIRVGEGISGSSQVQLETGNLAGKGATVTYGSMAEIYDSNVYIPSDSQSSSSIRINDYQELRTNVEGSSFYDSSETTKTIQVNTYDTHIVYDSATSEYVVTTKDLNGEFKTYRTKQAPEIEGGDVDARVIQKGGVNGAKSFKGWDTITGLAKDVFFALSIYGVVKWVGGLWADGDPEKEAQVDALSWGVAGGYLAGRWSYKIMESFRSSSVPQQSTFGYSYQMRPGQFLTSAAIGVAIGYLIYYYTYKYEEKEIVTFECYPWEAPEGGKECEKCNNREFPCSEYQCRSLGQSCQLLNQGTSEELCTWVDRKDTQYPVIQTWDVLPEGYRYSPDNSVSPPDRGVRIINTDDKDGCVEAFFPLMFGITTNEPATCKLDYERKQDFESMQFYFGGTPLSLYNHTQIMSLPGPSAAEAENLTIQNDGEFEVYTKCKDANGNYNLANFVFTFCVQEGPDTTPPLIVTTSVMNNMPIGANQTSLDLSVYTNEPADCKWSTLDQDYQNMENDMQCSSSILEMNAQMLYECETTLTGLKDQQENNFFFRCKDQPNQPEADRNLNQESYEFTLIGTRPLVITDVGPDGETIKDSTSPVTVNLEAKTAAGFRDGEATCYYSDTGEEDSYIKFYETGAYQHTQEVRLIDGTYTYHIRCLDLGGNADEEVITFDVETDVNPPMVVRVFKDDTYLKLITNEKAECVYDSIDCTYNFEDGVRMTVVDETEHFTDWKTENSLYIKCRDEYGKEPNPDVCSIIVRPVQENYQE